LEADGVEVYECQGTLLHEPGTVLNRAGRPFQVFTPFWRACLSALEPAEPLRAPRRLPGPRRMPRSVDVADPVPQRDEIRARQFDNAWRPGEAGAVRVLREFISTGFEHYSDSRNLPAVKGTSRLSPHLHFGEISARQVWHAVRQAVSKRPESDPAWRRSQFLAELGWREFAHHLLHHFPRTPAEPLRPEFRRFPWRKDPAALDAWRNGMTGYPIVDAGMRELAATGWMHNRVRMITASFLVKDLRISWLEGARWFWEALVDADLAQNTLGWQWTAGCGADAAPFFRIFNPALQGAKFDPQGDYVRRWCPELAALPNRWIHQPHRASPAVLLHAGIELGNHYPVPIINHAIAREVALDAYRRVKQRR
jgi:deoxyribodipyrimidine photo-lyase